MGNITASFKASFAPSSPKKYGKKGKKSREKQREKKVIKVRDDGGEIISWYEKKEMRKKLKRKRKRN